MGPGHEPGPDAARQWQGAYGAADPLAPGPYDTGSFAAGSAPGYDTGSFGRADTGSDGGWAFTPGSRGYDPDPLGQGSESLSGPPAGGFGPDSGTFGRPDTGSFGRPDTGAFGRPDVGSFGRGEDYDRGDPGRGTRRVRGDPGPPP